MKGARLNLLRFFLLFVVLFCATPTIFSAEVGVSDKEIEALLAGQDVSALLAPEKEKVPVPAAKEPTAPAALAVPPKELSEEELLKKVGAEDPTVPEVPAAAQEPELSEEELLKQFGGDVSSDPSLEDPTLDDPSLADVPFEDPAASAPEPAGPLEFEIPIPRIGTFVLKGNINMEEGSYHFDGRLKEVKPLKLGPLIINPLVASFSKKSGLQIKGSASLFGRLKFAVMLEKFIPGQEVQFSLEGPVPLVVYLSPWKRLEFKKLYLGLSKKTQRLFSRASLASKKGEEGDVELSVGLEKGKTYAELKIPELRSSFIVPPFKGTILDNISIKDVLLKVTNFLKKPTVIIAGRSNLATLAKGLPVKLSLPDVATRIEVSARGGVKFQAFIAEEKKIRPFAGTGVKQLEDIFMEKIFVGFDVKKKELSLQGSAKILGVPTTSKLSLVGTRLQLMAELEKGWKISSIIPAAAPLDPLTIDAPRLLISNKRYYDQELGVQIGKGINLIGNVPLVKVALKLIKDSELNKIFGKILSVIPPSLQLSGSLGTSLPDIALMVGIPVNIKLFDIPKGPQLFFKKIAVRVTGDGPSISALLQVAVRPTPRDQMLIFTSALRVGALSVTGAGTMQGEWIDPLGIASLLGLKKEKLAIFDCALEVGWDYKVVKLCIATIKVPIPTVWGFTGGLKVGNSVARMALKATTRFEDFACLGRLHKEVKNPKTGEIKEDMILFKDIVMFANELGVPIPVAGIPKIGFLGEIRFCPKGATIGEIYIDQGITFKGEIFLPNFTRLFDPKAPKHFSALVDMSLGTDGIRVKGTMSTIKFGDVFELTGAGFDKKYGTKDDGITLGAELSGKKQEFQISGKLKVGNDKFGIFKTDSQTDGLFNKDTFQFYTNTELFGGLVKVKLDMKTVGKDLASVQDFVVHGAFKDDFTDLFEKQVVKTLDKMTKEGSKALKDARAKVKLLEPVVTKRTQPLQNEINKLKAENEKRLAPFKNKLSSAQGKVDSIKKRIDGLKRDLSRVSYGWKEGGKLREAAKKAWYGSKIAIEWAAHKVAWATLEAVKGTVGALAKLDPRIVALEAAKVAAMAPLKIAQEALKVAEQQNRLWGNVAKALVKATGKVFKLKKASIDFSMKKLIVEHELPLITFDAMVLGKDLKNQKIQVDFTKPVEFFERVTKAVVKYLKEE